MCAAKVGIVESICIEVDTDNLNIAKVFICMACVFLSMPV
jgi:hypothetical protein